MTRVEELKRRSQIALATVGGAPAKPRPNFYTFPGKTTRAAAKAAARAAAGPNCAVDGVVRKSDGKFVPVVVLRADQGWMRDRVEERGAVVFLAAEVDRIIREAGL